MEDFVSRVRAELQTSQYSTIGRDANILGRKSQLWKNPILEFVVGEGDAITASSATSQRVGVHRYRGTFDNFLSVTESIKGNDCLPMSMDMDRLSTMPVEQKMKRSSCIRESRRTHFLYKKCKADDTALSLHKNVILTKI